MNNNKKVLAKQLRYLQKKWAPKIDRSFRCNVKRVEPALYQLQYLGSDRRSFHLYFSLDALNALPERLIEYVVVKAVAKASYGQGYISNLTSLLPDWEERRKELWAHLPPLTIPPCAKPSVVF